MTEEDRRKLKEIICVIYARTRDKRRTIDDYVKSNQKRNDIRCLVGRITLFMSLSG